MTRPPTRSALPAPGTQDLDDLEELGDDAIIAQETEAHALRPRVNVSQESRSVVITEHPRRRSTEPPRGGTIPRSAGEATLVIRDRRALGELRNEIARRQAKEQRGNRALYMWGGLGVVAFVIGGVVAFLATDSHSDAASPQATGRVEAQAMPQVAAPAAKPDPAPSVTTRAVRLDDLPVEHEPKH